MQRSRCAEPVHSMPRTHSIAVNLPAHGVKCAGVNQRFVQFADPLAERHQALVTALAWLTLPLAALLAFAAYIVFRASRSLVQQVERTARAVSRQDPQALHLLLRHPPPEQREDPPQPRVGGRKEPPKDDRRGGPRDRRNELPSSPSST